MRVIAPSVNACRAGRFGYELSHHVAPFARDFDMQTGIVRPLALPPRLSHRLARLTPRAKIAYDVGYEPDVVIVGGGLAGLACARTLLEKSSMSFVLFESSHRSVLASPYRSLGFCLAEWGVE